MYVTIAQLKKSIPHKTLVQLSNDDYQAESVNDSVLEVGIDYTTQLIDGYLRSRYNLPFSKPHTLLTQLSIDICRHWLYQRRPEGRGLPEPVINGYKNAIKNLEAIQCGKLHLGVSTKADNADSDLADDHAEFKVRNKQGVDTSGY